MYEMVVGLRPSTTSRPIAAQRKGNDTEEGIPPQRPPTHKEDTWKEKWKTHALCFCSHPHTYSATCYTRKWPRALQSAHAACMAARGLAT